MKTCPTCQAGYPTNFAVCPQDGTALIEVGAWSPGAVVRGKYRILEKIGQGGMGAVYKALHVTFDELRAIKVISPELIHDQLFLKRFKHEAVITRKLQHPNAVRVDDIDEAEDGRPFIVMEFIEGESLRKLIQEQGAMPVARVCSVIKQSAAALDAAHRIGMVHRDIKPDNIVLVQTPEGEQAKVLDFGIAKIKEGRQGELGSMTLTGTGVVIGTPQYMSPEQAMGKRGDDLDGRSDLYSLGIVMYQMLTGNLPFKADTTMEMLMAHLQQQAPDVRAVRPELQIPSAVANVVVRLLAKKPDARPATAGALIEEIEQAEAEMGGPGETRLIDSQEMFEPPVSPPPPVAPARRQPTGPSRAVTGPTTPPPGPLRRSDAPRSVAIQQPAVPPPQQAYAQPQVRVQPPQARVKKPSQWGIWAALGILVVGLGAGAWYFTERQPTSTTESGAPNSQTPPTPTPSAAPPVDRPSSASSQPSQPQNPVAAAGESGSSEQPSGSSSASGTSGGREVPEPPTTRTTIRSHQPEIVSRPQPRVQPPPSPVYQPPRPTVDPKRISAAMKMGDFYFERGEYDKAIDEFQQGLMLDPSNAELRSKVARARRAKAAEDLLNR